MFFSMLSCVMAFVCVGILLAYPYTILSGGGAVAFGWIASVAPIVLGAMTVIWHIEVRRLNPEGKVYILPQWERWVILAYLFSPVLLNGVAIVLKDIDEPLSSFVFSLRYASLLIIPLLFLVFRRLCTAIVRRCEGRRALE